MTTTMMTINSLNATRQITDCNERLESLAKLRAEVPNITKDEFHQSLIDIRRKIEEDFLVKYKDNLIQPKVECIDKLHV